MRVTTFLTMGLLFIGCNDKDPGDSANGDDTSASDDTAPDQVWFEASQYRFDTLVIETDTTNAADLNGDDEADNKLPDILALANTFADLSPEYLNGLLSDSLADGSLIMLIDAVQQDNVLTMDFLLGDYDEDADVYSVNEDSYDGGTPRGRMIGGPVAEDFSFTTNAEYMEIAFTFIFGEPPVFIPLAISENTGTLGEAGASGILVGAIPASGLISQVLDPLIPQEDEGYDSSDYLNLERDELFEVIAELLDTNADVELDDGSMAISSVLSWSGTPTSF